MVVRRKTISNAVEYSFLKGRFSKPIFVQVVLFVSGLLSVTVVLWTSLPLAPEQRWATAALGSSHTPVQRPVTGAVSASSSFQKINVMYLKKVLHLRADEQ